MIRRPSSFALPLALASLVVGCGGSAVQQGPSDTLRAYSAALEQGRVDEAYRLLSDDAKRNVSLEAFRRAVKENPSDTLEIARAIARPSSDPVVTAIVTLPNGEELALVYEGDRWRLDAAAVDLYGQSTPRQALLGFLRAFERKRYEIILRYVPDAEKEGLAGDGTDAAEALRTGAGEKGGEAAKSGDDGRLTAEKLRASWEGPQKEQMGRTVQAIKAALPTATIEETGDQAAMSYGAGGTVAFVREHGVWKIRDF